MNAPVWLSAVATGAALALLVPARSRVPGPAATAPAQPSPGWMLRWRPVWSLLAGVAAATFISGPVGLGAGALAAVVTWVSIGRAEPARSVREREQVRRDLPHVVGLLADALRAGQAPVDALAVVVDALPGAATSRLAQAVPRLRLGLDPVTVWTGLAADQGLGPLGRTLARAHQTGAPVVPAVERLADDLARTSRAVVEDQARAVGVKAAVPLGACLLPAFLLLGIVPVVGSLLGTLGL